MLHRARRRPAAAHRLVCRVPEPLENRTLMAAQFVAELNPYTQASEPQQFAVLGSQGYFVAKSGTGDAFGLYRTDGTAAGTALVADGLSSPRGLTAAAGRLYFWANDAIHGMELWTSDGTGAGTTFLKDTSPGLGDGRPLGSAKPSADGEFFEFGGRVYFAQGPRPGGGEFWTSDGTPEGTAPFAPPTALGRPWDAAVMGGHLYFLALGPGASALWKSDGTAEGTVALKGFVDCTEAQLHTLTVFSGALYFAAPRVPGSLSTVLWKSDGTPEGTVDLKDPVTGQGAPNPADLVDSGGTLFFTSSAGTGGAKQLWKSDGTPQGTGAVVTDGAAPADVRRLYPLPGGGVVFAAPATPGGPSTDWELWHSDGTAEGTGLLREIRPGPASSIGDPSNLEFQTLGSAVYFAADDGVSGRELWRTDGTRGGTVRVGDLRAGWRASNPGGPPPYRSGKLNAPRADAMGVVNGRLVFSAAGDPDDYEPWASDGTAAGTAQLADLNRAPRDGNPRNLAAFDGALLAAADLGATEHGLFRSDGTAAGTAKISDVAPAPLPLGAPTVGNGFGAIGGLAYYAGEVASNGSTGPATTWAVYRTDGTAAGTAEVPGMLARGGYGLPPNPVVAANGAVYFTALRGPDELGLWRSDLTPEGTTLAVPYRYQPDNNPSFNDYARLTPAGGLLYFFGGESNSASTLWRTDGTVEGTVELTPGQSWVVPHAMVTTAVVGDRLFVTPWPGGLLVTDGTLGGTHPVPNAAAWEVAAFDGAAYFSVTGAHPVGGGSGPAIFRTDGTAAGTTLVKQVGPSAVTSAPLGLSAAGGLLYFWADDGVHGYEPWVSDGTDAGTRMVADLNPGPAGSKPASLDNFHRHPEFVGAAGRVVFAADDGTHGTEPWSTDGTAAGTRMEADVYPGPTGSDPGVPVAVGADLFFAATDPARGRELWKVRAPAAVVGRHLFSNNSAADGRNGAATASDDAAIDASKRALLPGGAATATNLSGYSRGINGVMIDVAGLAPAGGLTGNDFTFRWRGARASDWSAAPAPAAVTVRRGAGASGSDRVTLTWADGVLADGWPEVTLKANDRTGLARPDTFVFGNLRGDTGNDAGAPKVDAADLARTRAAIGSRGASNPFDHNRDGRVDVLDLAVVRRALFNRLAPVEWAAPDPQVASARTARRRAAYGIL
jgi:ELWxxDGT repeat protein